MLSRGLQCFHVYNRFAIQLRPVGPHVGDHQAARCITLKLREDPNWRLVQYVHVAKCCASICFLNKNCCGCKKQKPTETTKAKKGRSIMRTQVWYPIAKSMASAKSRIRGCKATRFKATFLSHMHPPLWFGESLLNIFPCPKAKSWLRWVSFILSSSRFLEVINRCLNYSFPKCSGRRPLESHWKTQAAAPILVSPDHSSICGCPLGATWRFPNSHILVANSAPTWLPVLCWQLHGD